MRERPGISIGLKRLADQVGQIEKREHRIDVGREIAQCMVAAFEQAHRRAAIAGDHLAPVEYLVALRDQCVVVARLGGPRTLQILEFRDKARLEEERLPGLMPVGQLADMGCQVPCRKNRRIQQRRLAPQPLRQPGGVEAAQ